MGKIILTVEGTTVGTVAEGRGIVLEKAVSEQDSGRLIQAYARSYASSFVTETTDPETGSVTRTPRQPSITDVLQAWFDGIVAGSIAHVVSVEKQVAAETASNSVQPISVT